MKTKLFTLFILSILSFNSQSSEFKFNNKNLNSLAALICLLDSQELGNKDSSKVYTHKTTVNKVKIGPKVNDEIIELTGTCNNIINKDSLKIVRLGEEFNISIDRSNKLVASGKLGIKSVEIQFKNNIAQRITIEDPLLLIKTSRDISKSIWAKSNQIFSFSKKKLSLKFARTIAATEEGGTLNFKSVKFFNVWNDQAFGCSLANKNLSQSECERFKNI